MESGVAVYSRLGVLQSTFLVHGTDELSTHLQRLSITSRTAKEIIDQLIQSPSPHNQQAET